MNVLAFSNTDTNHYYYEKKKKETFKQQIDFVLCDSCFWCASSIPSSRHFMINDNILSKCPVCDNDVIKLNPILPNDAYKFDYSPKYHVTYESQRGRSIQRVGRAV